MDAINKKFFKQVSRDISPVIEQFPEYAPVETLVFQWFPIVRVRPGNEKIHDRAPVVNNSVQLEAGEAADS
jgi:hypothetical protein